MKPIKVLIAYPFLRFSAVNARKITRTIDTIVPTAIQIVVS